VETLARATIRGRWLVVGVWLLLTIAGAIAAGKLTDRWFEQFSIPGYSAYEANQRTLETFGTGRQYPMVAVFRVKDGDIREQAGIERAIAAGAAVNKGSRTSSWFSAKDPAFVSADHRTMFAEIYAAGEDPIPGVSGESLAEAIRAHGHHDVTFVAERTRLAAAARAKVRPGDIVITLGAGDVTQVGPELLGLLGR